MYWEKETRMKSQPNESTRHGIKQSKHISSVMSETNDFIIRSINDLLDKDFKRIQGHTFSSNGMDETQVAEFLINETDKILFPGGEQYFSSIVNDEYDKTQGVSGILEIITRFINWYDLSKKPVEIFSSKFFESLKKHDHDERDIANFLIYRAQKILNKCGQEYFATEIEKQCESLDLITCLNVIRKYVDIRDKDGILIKNPMQ